MKYKLKLNNNGKVTLSRTKKRKIKCALGFEIFALTLISFLVSTPIPDFKPQIRLFSTSDEEDVFRAGEQVPFIWKFLGSPEKVLLIFGDGNYAELTEMGCSRNGMRSGTIEHSYALQGKYTPILKVWFSDGSFASQVLDLEIRNDAPLFTILFNFVVW